LACTEAHRPVAETQRRAGGAPSLLHNSSEKVQEGAEKRAKPE